jgi:hypothetical protein
VPLRCLIVCHAHGGGHSNLWYFACSAKFVHGSCHSQSTQFRLEMLASLLRSMLYLCNCTDQCAMTAYRTNQALQQLSYRRSAAQSYLMTLSRGVTFGNRACAAQADMASCIRPARAERSDADRFSGDRTMLGWCDIRSCWDTRSTACGTAWAAGAALLRLAVSGATGASADSPDAVAALHPTTSNGCAACGVLILSAAPWPEECCAGCTSAGAVTCGLSCSGWWWPHRTSRFDSSRAPGGLHLQTQPAQKSRVNTQVQ